jgi:hypothetical protein
MFFPADFKEGDQNKVLKNQSLIGVAFTRDSNAGSSLLKLNTIEGRLISRVQVLMALAGHSNMATTQRYIDLRPAMLKAAVELV